MPVLRSARALAEAPITTVKKDPKDAVVKSLQDQLAAAHAQNLRDKIEITSLRAEVARVKEEKDGEIDSIKAEKAKVTEELAAALVANARPAAQPNALVPVAQGGWATPLEHFLKICKYEIHDNAPMFPNEPPVPCTGAEKPIKIVLKLVDAAGELVTAPSWRACRSRTSTTDCESLLRASV